MLCGIGLGEAQSLRRSVGGGDLSQRALRLDRQGNGAAACAQVQNLNRTMLGDQLQRPIDQGFRVVARVENGWLDIKSQPKKLFETNDVGDGLALDAARKRLIQSAFLLGAGGIRVVGGEPGPIQRIAPAGLQQQHLRLDAGQAAR